jgi:hypothetical protein
MRSWYANRRKIPCPRSNALPFAGPARENFAPTLRASFSGNYAIYSLHNEHELVIVCVLHCARDAAAVGGGEQMRLLAVRPVR